MSVQSKTIKICLYGRVSTLLGQDPEHQLVHLRKYAAEKNYEVVAEFVDRGISGARERRPALDEMLWRARKNEFSIICVSALDRLGRNTKHMLTLIDELKSYGVSIVSLREGIDFSSPVGQMMLTVISAIAQLERSLISERIKNALAAKKIEASRTGSGWKCGRPLRITRGLREQIFSLRQQGKSLRSIARETGVGKTTVIRVLKGGPK